MNDLDRQAAELVMGWVWSEEHEMWCVNSERDADGRLTFCNPDELSGYEVEVISGDAPDWRQTSWHPSTNIFQALGDGGPGTIVGRMRELGWAFHFHSRAENREMGVGFSREWSSYRNLELYEGIPAAAITEAAVRAVKGETNVG